LIKKESGLKCQHNLANSPLTYSYRFLHRMAVSSRKRAMMGVPDHRTEASFSALLPNGREMSKGVITKSVDTRGISCRPHNSSAETLHSTRDTNMTELMLESIITCPECGHESREKMPTDACQFFYECRVCATILKPRSGDCCVFCSYGSVKCPPIQQGNHCC
jgi:hypothetical protein